jgi:hypothetical protein
MEIQKGRWGRCHKGRNGSYESRRAAVMTSISSKQ